MVAKDIPRNRWVPIIIHYVVSREERGMFQVWFDKDSKKSPSYNAKNINFGFGEWNEDDTLGKSSSIGPKWGQYDRPPQGWLGTRPPREILQRDRCS